MKTATNTFSRMNCVDIDKLNEVFNNLEGTFISRFRGVPIKVDDSLKDNEYYVVVSRETFDKIREDSMEVK